MTFIAIHCIRLPTVSYLTLHHTTFSRLSYIRRRDKHLYMHVCLCVCFLIYVCLCLCMYRYAYKCAHICTQMLAGVPACIYMSDAPCFNIDYVSRRTAAPSRTLAAPSLQPRRPMLLRAPQRDTCLGTQYYICIYVPFLARQVYINYMYCSWNE